MGYVYFRIYKAQKEQGNFDTPETSSLTFETFEHQGLSKVAVPITILICLHFTCNFTYFFDSDLLHKRTSSRQRSHCHSHLLRSQDKIRWDNTNGIMISDLTHNFNACIFS